MDFLEFIITVFFADHLASKQEEQEEWERMRDEIEELRVEIERLKDEDK
ncbi:MAG: hypothetical protein JRI70_08170 [Deltaproteobacteria bacterium]|nr:hypothetical protein [Deltaproteobacteria bacterium]